VLTNVHVEVYLCSFTLAVLLFYAVTDSVTADDTIYYKCSNRREIQFQC